MGTEINKRIKQIITLNRNVKVIEVSEKVFNDINEEILDLLNKKEIYLEKVKSNTDLKAYPYKIDCFAYKNKKCKALREINCIDCKFYNNKINFGEIENAIKLYGERKK